MKKGTMTRFGLLHPTKNPNRSSQLFPVFFARILMFARRHSFACTATTHGPISIEKPKLVSSNIVEKVWKVS